MRSLRARWKTRCTCVTWSSPPASLTPAITSSSPAAKPTSHAASPMYPRARSSLLSDCAAPHRGLPRAAMIVFPAIDLKDGQVVRLAEGDMARATVYGDDPAAQALLFADAGAEHLHVVDLDGSFAGRAENRAAVEVIVEAFPGYVQLGGGIRTREAVEGWFDLGVARIVMGTAALKDPEFVRDMAEAYPGGVVVAVDAKDGMVATEGWAEVSDMP